MATTNREQEESFAKHLASFCPINTLSGSLCRKERPWRQDLLLSPSKQLRPHHNLRAPEYIQPQLAEVEAELTCLSILAPWKDFVPFPVKLPGFALLVEKVIGA